MLYGQVYAWCRDHGVYPGYTFWLAAFIGAGLPELMQRCMGAAEMAPLQRDERARIEGGVELATAASGKRKQ